MADARFKPIGGMFQGVRGSTTEGGTWKQAAKLIKLNSDGYVDETCLSVDVREVTHVVASLSLRVTDIEQESIPSMRYHISGVAEGLENEIAARTAADAALREALDNGDEQSKARIDAIAVRVQTLEETVSQIADHGLVVDEALDDHVERIRNLENVDSQTQVRIENLDGRVASVDTRLSSVEGRQQDIESALAEVSRDIGSYGSQLAGLVGDLADIQSAFSDHKSENEANFSSIRSELSLLSAKVDEIYRRIINCG